MNTQIGITEANRKAVSQTLSKFLADESVLYTKTKDAHWNIEGPDFHSMHTFFDLQIEELDEIIDNLAERIRSLGHYAPAALKSFLQLTHLTEMSRQKNDSQGFIKELLADHEVVIIKLRQSIRPFADDYADAGTSDFITGLLESHEKMAWFLRSHLN